MRNCCTSAFWCSLFSRRSLLFLTRDPRCLSIQWEKILRRATLNIYDQPGVRSFPLTHSVDSATYFLVTWRSNPTSVILLAQPLLTRHSLSPLLAVLTRKVSDQLSTKSDFRSLVFFSSLLRCFFHRNFALSVLLGPKVT